MNIKEYLSTRPGLWKHQEDCLLKYADFPSFALLAAMGVGKSKIIIENAVYLHVKGEVDRMLVIAPNGVHTNWYRIEQGKKRGELVKHLPDDVDWKAFSWEAKDTKTAQKQLKEICAPSKNGELKVMCVNWEALQNRRGQNAVEEFLNGSRNVLIAADESDSMKNPKSMKTKFLLKMRKRAKYRRIMTGTPINNEPADIFTQFYFLDPAILGTDSYYAFRSRYSVLLPKDNPIVEHARGVEVDPVTGEKVFRTKGIPQIIQKDAKGRKMFRNLDKLSRIIAPYSFRVNESILNLPPKVYKHLQFDMTPEQKEVYETMKNECRIVFAGDPCPINRLAALQKLQQITSGYVKHPDYDDQAIRIPGENPKLDLSVDRIRAVVEQGKKIIVWARYIQQIDDIIERLNELGIRSVRYDGRVTAQQKILNKTEFQEGDVQVFIGNTQSGGSGIELTAATYALYYSNDFSYRGRAQSEKRPHRGGQKFTVTFIDISARGTIDEEIIDVLDLKRSVKEKVIDEGLTEDALMEMAEEDFKNEILVRAQSFLN